VGFGALAEIGDAIDPLGLLLVFLYGFSVGGFAWLDRKR
jgi:hypothetical protein